jgi:two-component system NarL family sensor kinase
MFTEEARIYLTFLIGVFVLTVFTAFFFITVYRQQKQKNRLQKKLIDAEVQTIEKERDRIARDLHDELSPLLSSIRFQLMAVKGCGTEDDVRISSSVINLEQSLKNIRTITTDLMPLNLNRKGLWATVKEFAAQINSSHALQISVVADDLPSLHKGIQIHLFRIITELIHNCLKHADAQQMAIAASLKKSTLEIIIEDNGMGFDYFTQIEKESALGLKNVMNRINLLKGTFFIESEKGKGTYYRIEIPITHE